MLTLYSHPFRLLGSPDSDITVVVNWALKPSCLCVCRLLGPLILRPASITASSFLGSGPGCIVSVQLACNADDDDSSPAALNTERETPVAWLLTGEGLGGITKTSSCF